MTIDFAIAWVEAAFLNRKSYFNCSTSSDFTCFNWFQLMCSSIFFHHTSFRNSGYDYMSYCRFDREVINVWYKTRSTEYCFTNFSLFSVITRVQWQANYYVFSRSCRLDRIKHFILLSEHVDFATFWSNQLTNFHCKCEFRSFSNCFVDSSFIEDVVHQQVFVQWEYKTHNWIVCRQSGRFQECIAVIVELSFHHCHMVSITIWIT